MAYIWLSKRVGQAFPGGSGLALAMAVGALVVLPAGVIQGGSALLEPELLGSALVVALASSVLPTRSSSRRCGGSRPRSSGC